LDESDRNKMFMLIDYFDFKAFLTFLLNIPFTTGLKRSMSASIITIQLFIKL